MLAVICVISKPTLKRNIIQSTKCTDQQCNIKTLYQILKLCGSGPNSSSYSVNRHWLIVWSGIKTTAWSMTMSIRCRLSSVIEISHRLLIWPMVSYIWNKQLIVNLLNLKYVYGITKWLEYRERFSNAICQLQRLLRICEQELVAIDMVVNPSKSCCVRIGARSNVVWW